MAARKINKIVYGFLGIAGIVLSFIALLLLSETAKNSENFVFDLIQIISFLGVITSLTSDSPNLKIFSNISP